VSTPAATLCVLAACHHVLVAVPVRWVARLVLPDEVTAISAHGSGRGCLGTVSAGGVPYAAWDLGELLGLAPLTTAWILLEVHDGGVPISIALRTGACLMVQPLRPEASLPGTIFQTRQTAFPAAFSAALVSGETPALYGLWLDPSRLFTREELGRSRSLVEEARGGARAS